MYISVAKKISVGSHLGGSIEMNGVHKYLISNLKNNVVIN